jgi:hypothetical protein
MKMRRIALALTAAGMISALGLAGTPAQAHEWWGYHQGYQQDWRGYHRDWRAHDWREHRDWHGARFERHMWPRLTIFRG